MGNHFWCVFLCDYLLVFLVDCRMAKDIFLVDTRVIALLAFKRLGALMIKHVLLQDSPQGF